MCQYDTDTPAQGQSSPVNKHFAKNEVELLACLEAILEKMFQDFS